MSRHARLVTTVSTAVAAASALGACAGGGGGGAATSCPGPALQPASATIAPGEPLTVAGEFFRACYDTGQEGTPPPSTDVALELRQGGRSYELGVVDARPGGSITWDVTVPEDLRPGRARLTTVAGVVVPVEVRDPGQGGGHAQDQGMPLDEDAAPQVSAVCEAPSLAVSDDEVMAGSQVTVTGRSFLATCNDTGQGVADRPREGITLTLRQDGRTYDLATVDADPDGSFAVEVVLPDELEAGRAVLLTDRVAQVAVTVDG